MDMSIRMLAAVCLCAAFSARGSTPELEARVDKVESPSQLNETDSYVLMSYRPGEDGTRTPTVLAFHNHYYRRFYEVGEREPALITLYRNNSRWGLYVALNGREVYLEDSESGIWNDLEPGYGPDGDNGYFHVAFDASEGGSVILRGGRHTPSGRWLQAHVAGGHFEPVFSDEDLEPVYLYRRYEALKNAPVISVSGSGVEISAEDGCGILYMVEECAAAEPRSSSDGAGGVWEEWDRDAFAARLPGLRLPVRIYAKAVYGSHESDVSSLYVESLDTPTGVAGIAADGSPARYYDLWGRRVAPGSAPRGVVVRVGGGGAAKAAL